ncbi:MAG: hypothetical protein HY739_13110 [Desulfobacterales bacterium]|nr:hypothetical protein [Desulfobacterales bacterium]
MSETEIKLEDIIYEEIESWINEQIEISPKRRSDYLDQIARHLGICTRQLRRYYDGETDIPTQKLLTLCRFITTTNPVIHLNYELGIEAFEPPKLDEMDQFDVTEEIRKGLQSIGAYLQTFSNEVQKAPNGGGMKKIRIRERQLIMQIRRCTRLYEMQMEDSHKRLAEKAHKKRVQRQEKLRQELEEKGQMRMFE